MTDTEFRLTPTVYAVHLPEPHGRATVSLATHSMAGQQWMGWLVTLHGPWYGATDRIEGPIGAAGLFASPDDALLAIRAWCDAGRPRGIWCARAPGDGGVPVGR